MTFRKSLITSGSAISVPHLAPARAYAFDNGQTDEGRVFAYYGGASGLFVIPSWRRESDQAAAFFGFSVAPAGDVNGDGYADVLVGAHFYDNGQADEGRAYLYLGSNASLPPDVAWTVESDQAGAAFGASVATAGDVNGDGYSDVIVGTYQFDSGQANEGRANLYLGSAAGLAAAAGWTITGDQGAAHLGAAVATAGDVNGDGYADVLVGAIGYDNGQLNEGRAYLYLGSASGLSITPAWMAEGNRQNDAFGGSLGSAGGGMGSGGMFQLPELKPRMQEGMLGMGVGVGVRWG